MKQQRLGVAETISRVLPLVLAGTLLACGSGAGTTDAGPGDSSAPPERVVAEVDGVPILASRVEKAGEAERLRLAAARTPLAANEDL